MSVHRQPKKFQIGHVNISQPFHQAQPVIVALMARIVPCRKSNAPFCSPVAQFVA